VSLPNNWTWLRLDVVLAIHEAQLAEHGGQAGIRSHDLLESALARPESIAGYDANADVVSVGAMYAIGIVRNHPFLDGNKRTGWVAMRTFFALNEIELTFSPAAAVAEVLALAAGERDDATFTAWVRACAQP
jgi:death-on-curing protein